MEKLITKKELSEKLNVSIGKIDLLLKKKQIPYYKMDRLTLENLVQVFLIFCFDLFERLSLRRFIHAVTKPMIEFLNY